jgi:preprotein translocase SecE subunit
MNWIYVKTAVFAVVVAGLAIVLIRRREQLGRFFSEVRFEMTKVVWPSMDEVQSSTILVGVVTIALSLVCFAADWVFIKIMANIL